MRKMAWRYPLISMVAGWCVALSGGDAANLIRNGDMTEGTERPDGWSMEGDKAKGEMVRDAEAFVSGPASLKLVLREEGKLAARVRLPRETAGKRITATAQAKKDGAGVAQLVLMAFDKDWKGVGKSWQVIATVRGNEWQKVEGTAEVPEGAVNIMIQVWLQGPPVTAWIDDMVVASADLPAAAQIDALPVAVPADDAMIVRSGRWATPRAGVVAAQWPASALTVRFNGTALNGVFDSSHAVMSVAVRVDDGEATRLDLKQGTHRYALARDLKPGEHTVQVVKRTESFAGTWRVEGFEISEGGAALAAPAPTRRLEVIGDSISAGYGNEAPDQHTRFSPSNSNADIAYGALAARAVGADYACYAWSGQWMATASDPEKEMPTKYGRTLPTDRKSTWDFAGQPPPDAVVVNLATNDFNQKAVPEEEAWVAGYKAFVERLRGLYPKARIYLAAGPMLSGGKLETVKRYLARVADELKDGNVARLDFPQQDGKAGFGADWHPSAGQHQKMADVLVMALKKDLGW